jgi:hypothetical protein
MRTNRKGGQQLGQMKYLDSIGLTDDIIISHEEIGDKVNCAI